MELKELAVIITGDIDPAGVYIVHAMASAPTGQLCKAFLTFLFFAQIYVLKRAFQQVFFYPFFQIAEIKFFYSRKKGAKINVPPY